MLYPKNQKKFDSALFKNPTSEYRCTPFWAWNCELKRDELLAEIDIMKEMGMGGFHMHPRAGMSTKYLSDDFMALIKACNEKAIREGMLSWLYDEDKWPSGFAGGYVTKNPANRQKYLLFTPNYLAPEDFPSTEVNDAKNDDGCTARVKTRVGDGGSTASVSAPERSSESAEISFAEWEARAAELNATGRYLAKYDITLDESGNLASYRRLSDGESAENVWYAYIDSAKSSAWYNFETYVDTLSKSAIEEFVRITHDRYKEVLGDEFGKSVPAIFTDEPQVTHKKCLDFATQKKEVVLPYTTDFDDTYTATYGESFLDKLPEVVWELPYGVSPTRYRYHDHAAERFISAFCDTVGDWCKENGIYATGHMMEEPTLRSQTVAIGEAMRAYRSLTLPGIDMLCDRREFTTAKQAASGAHQYGAPGVMSELYGVTNWSFDFRGHKLQGDWQAALGVSVRVPHLYWVSMRGEAKRDYPASIGHQSAWYKEYSFIEDHFARVNTLMTRGKPCIRVGVIHPIESYWLHFGPNDQTLGIRSEMDKRFSEITDWLLQSTLDFDYVSESLLKDIFVPTDEGFRVGEMTYDAVVVPACETLRATTLAALTEFADRGGKVIFMGDAPTLVDAQPSCAAKDLAMRCTTIDWNRTQLVSALEPYRTVKIQAMNGAATSHLFYGMREEDGDKHLFICHAYNSQNSKIPAKERYVITVMGEYAPTLMDTETGEVSPIPARYEGGNTKIDWECYPQSSILLTLTPGKSEVAAKQGASLGALSHLDSECELILHEPNVSVIDMARWKIDDGEWQPKLETLLISKRAKEMLTLSTASINGAQPWVFCAPKPTNTITIEATVSSEVEIPNCELALENFEECDILWNGEPVEKKCSGYYVDFSIKKTPIGTLKRGENTVRVTMPFGVVSNVENLFLLGDFGVSVIGSEVKIVAPKRTVRFGDLTAQGLAFYGGEVTYRVKLEGGADTSVALGLFSAPAVTVSLDGEKIANTSLAPHTANLGMLSEGEHTLDINVYLSRVNTFGTFHNSDHHFSWFGPGAWYPSAENYCYEYRLEKTGLLTSPRIYKK
ncbi:MAG: hypothetical protein IJY65_01245 [Clostridia bacterium]|nr:hypothetical protein [Clostridia bacterium]